jgi:NAD(P)-dependent dehydrogenase (short-subunit alcohol dehydrogenase family)
MIIAFSYFLPIFLRFSALSTSRAFNLDCPITNSIQGPPPFQPPPKSLLNKAIVITGGNTGLGLESAKRLAKAGATVVITSRNLDKGKKAVEEIQRYCSSEVNNQIFALHLDLCSLQSVRNFVTEFKDKLGPETKIDVLLNNAGVMAIPKLELTSDNYEKTFQSNHLGHFALTALLYPMLSQERSKVINVSSAAHQIGTIRGLDLGNLNGEKSYGPWTSYGASKLANILFTKELQRRVTNSGNNPNFKAFSLHPGVVRTDLYRYLIGENNALSSLVDFPPLKALALFPTIPFTKSVESGATTQIWLASGRGDDELYGGEYLVDCKAVNVAPAAADMDKAKQLWRLSEEMCGLHFAV